MIAPGAKALLLLVVIGRRPPSAPRLVAEAFVTALAVITSSTWEALWPIEQRW